MMYKDWIELGFIRIDLDDNVEVNEKGYGGYFLEKQLTPFLKIAVYWDKLGVPFLQTDIHENEDSVIRQYVSVDFATNLAKLF